VVYQRHYHPSISNRNYSVANKSESANVGYLWECSRAWRLADRITSAETEAVVLLCHRTLRVYPTDIHIIKATHMAVDVVYARVIWEYPPHGTASKVKVFCTHNSIRTNESHGGTNTTNFANSRWSAHRHVITQIRIPFSHGSLLVVGNTLSDSLRSLM
jgi:hypothetical protein